MNGLKYSLFALALFCCSCVELPELNNPNDPFNANRYGSIAGRITDQSTNNTIVGATVTTGPTTSTATTDASGNYTIANVAPGSYTVSATKIAYTANTTQVNVIGGNTSTANITLSIITGTITGKITDSSTSQGIQGVTVTTDPTTTTTTTNVGGNYMIENVSPGSYTVRASIIGYISNSTPVNITSGNTSIADITVSSLIDCPSSIIYYGKTYPTIQVGFQCWLKENLNVGTKININTWADSMRNNGDIEKYCYQNLESNCTTYGGLYQWDEAMQYVTNEGAQGICPTGWHIPTKAEFDTLEAAVNNNGNSLKAIGQGSQNGSGTNLSGFSGLLAGYLSNGAIKTEFEGLSDNTYFWGSTPYQQYVVVNCYSLGLMDSNNLISFEWFYIGLGLSVRCIKD